MLKTWPRKGQPPVSGWISRTKGPSSQIVEPGDTMDLAIWDNSESSLITQSGQKVVELKGLKVSPAGDVFLPYVDQVYVAKMSPDRARDTIQQKFAAIIPSAQVQLSHTAGRQSSVDLVSGDPLTLFGGDCLLANGFRPLGHFFRRLRGDMKTPC